MTTLRLPLDLYEALRRRAFEQRRPLAEILREALAAWLEAADVAEPLPRLSDDPLWRAVGTVPGGSPDEAEAHDRDLYGARVAEEDVAYAPPSRPKTDRSRARSGGKGRSGGKPRR